MIKTSCLCLLLTISIVNSACAMEKAKINDNRYNLINYGLGDLLSCDMQRSIAREIVGEVNPCLLQKKHKMSNALGQKENVFLWGVYSPDRSEVIQVKANVPKICNIKSGCVKHLYGHVQPVLAVAYNADGTKVVTGALDGRVIVWDGKKGKSIASFAHSGIVSEVDFSKDGKKILTNSVAGPKIIKIHTNKMVELGGIISKSSGNSIKIVETFIAFCPHVRQGPVISCNENSNSNKGLCEGALSFQKAVTSDVIAAQVKLSRGLCKAEAHQWFMERLLPQHAALIYLAHKRIGEKQLLSLKAGSHDHDVWENIAWQARELLKKIGISVNITKSKRKLLVTS